MEDVSCSDFQSWVKLQSDYAQGKLESLAVRTELLAELSQIDAGLNTYPGGLTPVGNRLFYMRTPPPTDVYQLFMRDGLTGAERLVFDPNQLSAPEGAHYALSRYYVSPDGKHAVCCVSLGGSEDTILKIVEVDTARCVDQQIDRAAFGDVNWLPDGRAFIYSRLTKKKKNTPATARFGKRRVYLHYLGTDIENDKPLLGFGLSTKVQIAEDHSASIHTSWDSDYMVGEIHDGVGPYCELYVAPLPSVGTGEIDWRKVCDFDDEISGNALQGRDIVLLSRKRASRGRLLRISCEKPDIANAGLVLPESDSIVTSMAVAKDALYVTRSDGIVSELLRIPPGTLLSPERPSLPLVGSIARIIHDPRQQGVILSLVSWTDPTTYYSFDAGTRTFSRLKMPGADTPSLLSLEARQVKVPSRDGTLVPLSIICRNGLERDGRRPCLLTGYGAYGIAQGPSFDLSQQPWFARGGVYAIAHVRGGGEYGEEWRLAGKGPKKQNGVDDFVACARYLVAEGYTAPAKLAAQGTSAGGVLVGLAVMQQPKMFGAAVMEVGALDALRFEVTPNGPPNIPEWGSTQSKEGFETLRALSPYEHIRPGTRYPAMLFTTGMNDPRVEPWQSAKMTARLQAATASGRPILLRVHRDEGHFQTTLSAINEHHADIWAFLLWQLGETTN
jgi:prolyl oligopeptidase